jgi:predicted ribosomally synthesized peptide with nif11-like leader
MNYRGEEIMSKVTEFYEAFSKDEAMQKRANALKGSGEVSGKSKTEAIIAFAKKEGYTFTAEEFKDFLDSKELSDDDLKSVAGGYTPDNWYDEKEWIANGNNFVHNDNC